MKVARISEMREIDTFTIEKLGIPGIILMENAAINVVKELQKDIGELSDKNVVVFAGKGNNGGDALAVARHLYNLGANVLVILLAPEESIKGDAQINLNIVKNLDIKLVEMKDESIYEDIALALCLADVVVDGLIGTGIKGKVDSLFSSVIKLINTLSRYVISIDIPSGVNGDTGEICGICIDANKTVTLGLPKPGLYIGEGAKFAGEVVVADIGIPPKVIESKKLSISLIDKKNVSDLIPKRYLDTHKGDYGKVLILAGSIGLTGAAALCSQAVLRSGAGLATVGIPATLNSIMECKLTEVMTLPLTDKGRGCLDSTCIEEIEKVLNRFNVVAVGPGLGRNSEITKIVSWLIEHSPIPLVIDADGINSLSENIDVLKRAKSQIVLTPHLGEMSRITGLSIETISKDRLNIVKQYAEKWNCTIVLKDWRTVIATPDGEIMINTTGNPGMATGGTGDVLTGIIASFIGQGLKANEASMAGVYIHGLAGNIASAEKGQVGMIAGDLLESIPYAIKTICEL